MRKYTGKTYLLLSVIILAAIVVARGITRDTSSVTWYKVVKIIDGDTLTIKYNGKNESLRLFGIDAPERGENGYFKAGAALEELAYGKQVRLEFVSASKRDKFGRLLAKVFLKDGKMLNLLLYQRKVVKLYARSPLIRE